MHEKERLLYRVERMVERKRRSEGEGVSEWMSEWGFRMIHVAIVATKSEKEGGWKEK
jgi:hypothetical protein